MSKNNDIIVDRIKILCKEHNIQMSELENRVGLSAGNISRWRNSLPKNILALIKISKILHTSIDFLLGLDQQENRAMDNVSTVQLLIDKTRSNQIEWSRVGYDKIKNIPSITTNKYMSEYYNIYSAKFKENILIFSYYKSSSDAQFYLWLCKNGEYIDINFTMSDIQELYDVIVSKNKQALTTLWQDLQEI